MKFIVKLLAVALLALLSAAHAESVLPAQLQIIEAEAFCGAADLGNVTLPEGVTEIHSRAFADSSLKSINLPASLSSIAEDAFDDCEAVTLRVQPGTQAWNWCAARGLTGAEWTGIAQTGIDSVRLTWTAPEGVSCDVLMLWDGEWATVASALTGGEYLVNGLTVNTEYSFALFFSGAETPAYGGPALTFSYSFQTDAQTLTITDYTYSCWIENGECILTGVSFRSDAKALEVRIPSELDGCPVTRIGSQAFTNMSALTKVYIPDSVLHIDSTTFYGCENLTSVEMTDSVLTVGDYAFAECSALSRIRLSDSITSIGECAFMNDSALAEMDLPDSLVSLGRKSLHGTSIASLALPDSLQSIGALAFSDSTTEILTGKNASAFTVSDGFLYSIGMTQLVWIPPNAEIVEFTAPETVTEIAPYVFADREDLVSASFPGGLTVIGESAFSGCTQLQSLSGTESLLSIGDRAFFGCAALSDKGFQSMTQLQSVGAFAFSGCASLTSVMLGTSMDSIGIAAFYGCSALESIQMPDELIDEEGFGSYMFYDCAKLQSVRVPAGVTELSSYAFYGCSELKTLILPDGLETIEANACFKCSSLTGLNIPSSVTSIKSTAFANCRSLTQLDLPACSIGNNAFGGCTALTTVSFAKHTRKKISLDERAFYACSKLEAAYLPANATSINASAFESCSKLKLYVEENSAALTFAVENNLPYEIFTP